LFFFCGFVSMSGITEELIKACRAEFDGTRGNRAIQNAIAKKGVMELALDHNCLSDPDRAFVFSDELKQTWSVNDQKSSGRCWIFSSLTVLRVNALSGALNVKDFEFSQVYVFFWFKFERSGYFLDEIIRTADRPVDDRLVAFLLEHPADDGGQFDFFKELVAKYGLVPKNVMPETFASEHTSSGFNPHLKSVLRSAACMIRKVYQSDDGKTHAEKQEAMLAIKRSTMSKVWTLLCMHLGTPPERFSYRWSSSPLEDKNDEDKDKEEEKKDKEEEGKKDNEGEEEKKVEGQEEKKDQEEKGKKDKDEKGKKEKDKKKKDKDKTIVRDLVNITPLEFVKFCGLLDKPETDFTKFMSLEHDPRSKCPPMRTYTVESLNVVAGAPPVRYLNLPSIQRMKEIALASIRDGYPVWFGADSTKYKNQSRGLFDMGSYDFKDVYGFDECELSKAERLEYGDSCMAHAMVFTGVNVVDGKTRTWKVENSWGANSGNKGIYIITDEWFDEYVYEIAVPGKYLTPEERSAYETDPIVLPAWDPMGTLAVSD